MTALLHNHRRALGRIPPRAAAEGHRGLPVAHRLQVANTHHLAQRAPGNQFADLAIVGRKTQDVAHLHQPPALAHGRVQRHTLIPRGPHRLLQQQVMPPRQSRHRRREVQAIGQGDNRALHPRHLQRPVPIRKTRLRRQPQLPPPPLAHRLRRLGNRQHAHILRVLQRPLRVDPPPIAHPQNHHPKGLAMAHRELAAAVNLPVEPQLRRQPVRLLEAPALLEVVGHKGFSPHLPANRVQQRARLVGRDR